MIRTHHEASPARAITRREFGIIAGGAAAAFAFGAPSALFAQDPAEGRLTTRPKPGVKTSISGTQQIDVTGSTRDAYIQMPKKVADGPLPLLLMYHGAGSEGHVMLERHGAEADEAGVVLLAPDSRGATWDAIGGDFTRDVTYVNTLLQWVFERVNVDLKRISIGGFSDGATYALSLGLINGDFFPRVFAFSPGFVIDGVPPHGKPKFFISHGTADPILPIDKCSRMIVPELRKRGYEVTFREFDGGHMAPKDIVRDAMHLIATGPL